MTSERVLPQERLLSVLEQVPAFFAITQGPDHVFVLANAAYRKLIHHRDVIGKRLRDALPELESQGLFELVDRVYRTGESYIGREQRVRMLPAPGGEPEERILDFVYQADRGPDGRVTGVIIHGVDVTAQVEARSTAQAQAEQLQKQTLELQETRGELEAANRRLAAAMREAEDARARLEAVIEQMPSGVVIADAESGDIVMGNQQVERIWRQPAPGRDPAWRERYVAFHMDGSIYEHPHWPLARALRGESTLDEEMRIRRADGTRGVISVSAGPIRDRDGTVVSAVAIFDDVTERSRHEHEQAFLVEAARVLASSLDYEETLTSVARLSVPRMADACAIDLLEDGRLERLAVVHVDPEKERVARNVAGLWPWSPEEPTGVARVLESGESEIYPEVTDDDLRRWTHDGGPLDDLRRLGVRSAMILPMVARGRTLGTITFVDTDSGRSYNSSDLQAAEKLASRAAMAIDNALLFRQAERSRDDAETAQRRAEDARRVAEEANRAKSEFLANMSHEMRTPLNAVTGYTELLEMELAGPLNDEQKGQLSRVRSSTSHLLSLINDLLDLARIEAGKMTVARRGESLADAVGSALALVTPQAAARGIEVVDECSHRTELTYLGDRDRVRQILVNVVGNAVKFTSQGGRVRITCGSSHAPTVAGLEGEGAPWTFVRVEDNGVGIDAAQMERIFRPFEQVEGGYTREAEGAGLGLAISRQLALLMGGDLTAASEPGVGSAFTLWLPSEEAGELPELSLHPERGGAGLEAVASALLAEVDAILEDYQQRLRADPLIPLAAVQLDAELQDHHSSLASDFAASMLALSSEGEARDRLLRDGSEIQRVVAELHGRQRASLGWTEEALRREFELWGETLDERLAASEGLRQEAELLADALRLLALMVDRTRRISLRAFRAARLAQGVPEE